MNNCKPISMPIIPSTKLRKNDEGAIVNSTLYKQLVGSLMYLIATRPDIMLASISVHGITKEITLEGRKNNTKVYCRNNATWYFVCR